MSSVATHTFLLGAEKLCMFEKVGAVPSYFFLSVPRRSSRCLTEALRVLGKGWDFTRRARNNVQPSVKLSAIYWGCKGGLHEAYWIKCQPKREPTLHKHKRKWGICYPSHLNFFSSQLPLFFKKSYATHIPRRFSLHPAKWIPDSMEREYGKELHGHCSSLYCNSWSDSSVECSKSSNEL